MLATSKTECVEGQHVPVWRSPDTGDVILEDFSGLVAEVVKPTNGRQGLARGSLITYCSAAACCVMLQDAGDLDSGVISPRSPWFQGRQTLGR